MGTRAPVRTSESSRRSCTSRRPRRTGSSPTCPPNDIVIVFVNEKKSAEKVSRTIERNGKKTWINKRQRILVFYVRVFMH